MELIANVAREGTRTAEVNIVALSEGFHINVRASDEGMILDSYDPDGELAGTVCMDWDQWAEYLEGR